MQILGRGLYKLCDWIMTMAYLNLLWLMFTLMGLLLFGIFPATISLFAVMSKFAKAKFGTDMPVFKFFWASFREQLRLA